MADPKTQMLQVSLPGAGKTQTYQLTAGTTVKFGFDIAEAEFTGNNGNLEIALEGGGTVILENYQALADAGTLPTFEMMDGEQVAGDVYLFAFADTGDGEETELETAADGAATGSGAGDYSDDAGQLGDGIDALGGQGDAYDARALAAIPGVEGNSAPIANDDFNEITEIGDPDFDPEQHVTYVPGEGDDYPDDTPRGTSEPIEGDFFALGNEGAGFYINYPNELPQIQDPVAGNVIANDFDPDPAHSVDSLLMNSIDYAGIDSTGLNPGPVDIPSTGQTVEGLYGTLFIEPNGDYTYTLNEELADRLEEGETFDEVFNYTIEDPVGAVSNTAQLTVTVYGSNDAPYAVADTNVQAIEHGDSTAYQYPDGYPVFGDDGSETATTQMVLEPGSDLVDPTPGVDGYGTEILAGEDDAALQVDLSSVFTNGLNFYGTNYDAATDIYISTNGLISFGHENTSYLADGIATYTDGPLIAIQYDDFSLNPENTGFLEGGKMYYHVDADNGIVTITWEGVGSYDTPDISQGDTGNFVQIRLHDLGNGDFGIEYRYDDVSWQSGYDDSDPTAGWTAGDGSHFGLVMGSGTGDFVNVEDTSNVGQSGVYAWEVRDGQVSGELHDYTVAVGASGNVLANDSDVDDNDMVNEPGEPTDLFVMGVYSAHPSDNIDDQLDYAMPTVEDDLGGTIEYPQVSPAQASFTVQGHYGTLTIDSDGSYVYTLDDDNENSDLEALNYDRPGTDSFTYAVMDDSGAMDYANLTFTVNGANDAPVAYSDTNSIIEWGAGLTDLNDFAAARFDGGEESTQQTDTIHGDVINGDAHGGVADTDVDDTEIFVSRIYTKGEEEQTPPEGDEGQPRLAASGLVVTNEADVYNDDDQEVTIEGQFGTLTIRADGSYDYTLNNENPEVDALNVDDSLVETFYYTARNSYDDGVESNEAELNITIYGNNDNPEVSITRPARFDGEFIEDGAHEIGSGAVDILGGHGIQISDVDNIGAELTVTVTQDVRFAGDILSFDVLRANGNPHPQIQTIDGDNTDGITEFQFKGVLVTIDNNTGTIFMEAADGRTPGFNQFEQAMKRITFEIDSEDDTPNTADRDFTVTVRDDNSNPADPYDIDGQGHYSVEGVASTSFTLHVTAANDAPVAENDGIYQVTELSDVTDGGCHLFDGSLGVLLADLLGIPTSELPQNVAEGNVLANDWDPDQFAYGDTGAPDTEDNPNDLTDLRVIGLKYDGEPDLGETSLQSAPPTGSDPFSPVGDTLADGVFVQGLYGRLYMDDEGNFRYVADTEAANALAEGHSATETFTYMISDGDASLSSDPNAYNDPATDTATVTFQIHGSNDQATIIVDEGADQGTVTEVEWVEAPVDPNDDTTWASGSDDPDDFTDSDETVLDEFGNIVVTPAIETLTTGGQLFVDDPDQHPHDPATFTNLAGVSVQVDLEDTFQPDTEVTSKGGTFSINELGEWTYEIDNTLPVVQTMGDGESFTETFEVTSYDGTDSHTITVTVEGSNDAPVITSIAAPVEGFESGAGDWDISRTGSLVDNPIISALNDLLETVDDTFNVDHSAIRDVLENRFLGLFGEGESTQKTFMVDADAETVTVEFDMLEAGLWNESFNAWIASDSDDDSFIINIGGNTFEIPLVAFQSESYSDTLADGSTISFGSYPGMAGSFLHHVTITVPAPASGELTVDLSANIESEWWDFVAQEAFGIDNVSVASYDADGLPMFSVIENTGGDTAVAQLGSSDVEGHAVHYEITGITDANGDPVDLNLNLFTFDGNTLVAHGGETGFDYEASSSYTVTVVPVDEQGGVGQDVDITVNIGNVNEPPTGEDFTMTVGLEGGPVPFLGADGSEGGTGDDADHVSDPEDPSYTGQELDVMITDLPDNGQLVYGPGQTPVTQADVDNGTQFDLNQLSYVPDGEAIEGVLLGSRVAGDAALSQWGVEQPDGSYDLVINGVTVTTSVTRNGDNAELTQYNEGANHIGFGIADERGQGLNGTTNDVLTVSFDGAEVSYAEVGFDGLGGFFNPGSTQQAFATWTAYDAEGNVVASGEVNNNGGDLFETLVLDASLLGEGNTFTSLEFSTVEHGEAGGANWELRYVDAEFTNTDTFDYIPVDSGLPGTDGELVDPAGPSTVTVNILPDAPVNQDPTAVVDNEFVYEPDTGDYAGMAAVTANVLDNDLDPDNTPGEMSLTKVEFDGTTYDFTSADPITITGDHGTLVIGSDGEYTYTATDETLPDGVNPTETFKYTMTDGDTVDNDPVAQSANLVIEVRGLNDAPVALDDAYQANEVNDGGIVTLGNVGTDSGGGDDYDPDTGETVPGTTPDTIVSFSAVGDLPAGVTLLPNGDVQFDQNNPAYDHLGVEETMDITFQYMANDGDADSNIATVTITVNGANDAPVLDLSAGTVTFEGEVADYNNMIGIYTMSDGNPVNPEIILVNANDPNLDIGDILTTYGDGAAPNYFLVAVGEGATPTGTPEFVWDEANGEWAISFDGGTTLFDARFDNPALNPNDIEDTFDPAQLLTGRVAVDDQLTVETDDDDFNDVLADEHDGALGADHGPVTFTEGGAAVGVTGAVDISDIDSDNMSRVEISFEEQPGDVLSITLPSWASFGPDDGDAGTMTIIGDAPKADWEALLQTLRFENTSQNPLGDDLDTEETIENLRDISVTVYDDQGAASNTAHAFVQVIPVNDPPVAVDDNGSASGHYIPGEEVPDGTPLYTFSANVGNVFQWATGGITHTGIKTTGEGNNSAAKTVDNDGPDEALTINFAQSQASVELDILTYGNHNPLFEATSGSTTLTTDTSQPTHLIVTPGTGNSYTVTTNDGTPFESLTLSPNGESNRFSLKGDIELTPADTSSGDMPIVQGNVLANDWDYEDVDYPEGDNPLTPVLEGSTELTVTGIATGDQDNLTDYTGVDFNPDSGTFATGAIIRGTHGVLEIGANGEYTYTPNADQTGEISETFTYQVSDTEGAVDYGLINVSVTIENQGPVADDDTQNVAEDTPTYIDVLANDSDPDGDPLSIDSFDTEATDGAGNVVGTVEQVGDQLLFTPEDGYSGPAHFNYTVTDGGLTDGAQVTLNVISTNDDPEAKDDRFDDQPGTENDFNVVTEGGTNFESNPVNYLLIVDSSGSMGEGTGRMEAAKDALTEMLNTLQEQINSSGGSVKVGIIDFWSDTRIGTYELTDDSSTEIQNALNFVNGFSAGGGTDYQDALRAANTWVTDESNGIETQVVFMSDGAPNNTHNWQDELATLHSNTNVIGVGIEMGSSNMQYINQINENGDGLDLDDPSDLNGLLQDILTVTSTEGTTATGNVLTNDIEPDGDTMSVVSVAFGDESSHGTFTALSDVGSGADDADTAVMVGTFGTLTINTDGTYEYVPDQPAADALATGETETEAFTYQMTDGQGSYDEATVSFLINGADDAPVAVNDVFAGMELTRGYSHTSTVTTNINDADFNGTISGGDYHGNGFTISGRFLYGNSDVVLVNQDDLGVKSYRRDDTNIDGYYDEDMTISFDAPQTSVTITLGDISDKDSPTFSVSGGSGSYSNGVFTATGNITSITIRANQDYDDSFYLESLSASRTVTSTSWIAALVSPNGMSGNVLTNDFDAEDIDHGDTAGASTELVVLGATGVDGYVSLADTTHDSATAGTIQGEYGTLTLNEDGTFQYNVDPALVDHMNHAAVETFEYQIADTDGMTSTATLEFPITLTGDNSVIVGTSGNDVLHDDIGDNVIFGLDGNDDIHLSGGNDTVTLGEGADTITIDPAYIGGNVEVTDFDINAGDQLDLDALGSGNLSITSDSGSSDLILTVQNVSGSEDLVITLNGVVSSHDGISTHVDLASDNVNDIIQQIIDSPDNF
nr:VCBS domain-containing protein [uncultured Pseudodesulfovibrio sp.]